MDSSSPSDTYKTEKKEKFEDESLLNDGATDYFIKDAEYGASSPPDRFFLVYMIFVLHGIGVLLPWNIFINAMDYYKNYKLNTTISMNEPYRNNFLNYVGFAAQFPNLLLSAVNVFFQSGEGSSNFGVRVVTTILLEIVVCIVTVILAMVDSSDWPYAFFIITMVSVVVINSCTGIYQSCVFGMAAVLPMKYSNAVVFGNNFCGTLIAIVNLIAKMATSKDLRTSAVYYFVFGIIILLLCFDTYFMLPLMRFYRFHQVKAKGVSDEMAVKEKAFELKEPVYKDEDDAEEADELHLKTAAPKNLGMSTWTTLRHCFSLCCFTGRRRRLNCSAYWDKYWQAFRMNWVHCLSVWSVFFCTLTCFPAIQAEVKQTDPNNFIPEKYWADIVCFLFFNFFAMCGNFVSNFVQFPSPKYLFIPVWLRTLIFIPFFIFSNFRAGNRLLPVFIANDYLYMSGCVVFGFTNGYFSSLCMMYAPRAVNPANAGIGAMLATFFLVFGIVCGINISAVIVSVITV